MEYPYPVATVLQPLIIHNWGNNLNHLLIILKEIEYAFSPLVRKYGTAVVVFIVVLILPGRTTVPECNHG